MAFCLVALLAAKVRATDTAAVGGDLGSELSINLSCSSDRVLSGVEINFSSTKVGKVRGVCRKVDEQGKWAGDPVRTSWSPTNVNTNYASTKHVSCPSDYAVYGFRGKTTSYRSAIAVNALQIICRKLTGTGSTSGSTQYMGWYGGSGVQHSAITCPSNYPARGIKGRSKTYVHKFLMSCSTPQVQSGPKVALDSLTQPNPDYPLAGWRALFKVSGEPQPTEDWEWIQEYSDGSKYVIHDVDLPSGHIWAKLFISDYGKGRTLKIWARKGNDSTNKLSVTFPAKTHTFEKSYHKNISGRPMSGTDSITVQPDDSGSPWPSKEYCKEYFAFKGAAVYGAMGKAPPLNTVTAKVVKMPNVDSAVSRNNTAKVDWAHQGQGMYYNLRMVVDKRRADCPVDRRQ